MRIFLLLIIFCLSTTLVFAKSTKSITRLYGDYLKGLFFVQEGDFSSALDELEKAKKLDPASPYIRLKIATVLIRLGKMERAEKELQRVKEIDPQSVDASLALIFLYSYTQQDDKLESEYEDFLKRAHAVRPQDVKVSEHLAQFYFYKKNLQEAIRIYEAVLKNNPDYVEGLFWLGYLYEEVGRSEDTVKIWKRALRVDPNHAPTLNSLGYIYAERGVNLDEAEKMVKRALEEEPGNGAYLDSLGWIYFKKKDYRQAEEQLKSAIAAVKDAVIYEHLGDLYGAMNNQAEAVNYYRKGLEYFPENENLKKKLNLYEGKNSGIKK